MTTFLDPSLACENNATLWSTWPHLAYKLRSLLRREGMEVQPLVVIWACIWVTCLMFLASEAVLRRSLS